MIHAEQNTEGEDREYPEQGESRRAQSEAELPGRPYWLLIGTEPPEERASNGSRGSVLTVEESGYRALPIFPSEAAAMGFLDSRAESGYRARETWAGELLSLLSGSAYSAGPCSGVTKVQFHVAASGMAPGEGEAPVLVDRQCFMEHLMGRGRPWFQSAR